MAETDFLVTAGVMPDIESAKKAGAALRAEIEKILGTLPSGIAAHAVQYASALGTARSGQEVYNAIGGVRAGIKRGVASYGAMGAILSTEQEDAIREAEEVVRRKQNIVRRVFLNDPTNKVLAERRKRIAEFEKRDPMAGLFFGQEDVSQTIFRNVTGRGLTDSERAQARVDALSAFGGAGADRNTISQAIYKNIYGKGMTPDERAQAKEDAIAAWSIPEQDPRRIMAAIQKNVYNRSMTPDERERERNNAMAVWATKDNTKAIKNLTVIASGVVATGLKTFAEVLPTYWHQNVTRSTMGTYEAQVARTKAIGTGVGGIGGSILGGIAGALVAGPVGAMIGAGVGSQIGGTVGGLWGDYDKERLESIKRSITQVQQRYRAQGIYGGQYGVGYANAVAETGMASAGDVEKMTHNSATLAARMMFGQVGENEMLMYSIMPGYFAAAMSGASSEQLAEAFSADLNRLPPQLRVWAAEGVGGGSAGMMAYVNSPNFGHIQRNAGALRSYDAGQMLAGAGLQVQSGVRGIMDRATEASALYSDISYLTTHQKTGVFRPENYAAELALTESKIGQVPAWMARRAYANAGRYISSGDGEDMGRGMGIVERATSRVLQTINVNIDGETVASQENTITEEDLRSQSLSYTLGI